MKKILLICAGFSLFVLSCSKVGSTQFKRSSQTDSDISGDLLSEKFLQKKNTPNFANPITVKQNNIFPVFALNTTENKYNDVARRLAEICSSGWEKLEENLSKIESWSNEHVTHHLTDFDTVFYPFGGPDVAYPVRFFPDQENYILVGCEPIGNFQDIERNIGNAAVADALKNAFSSYVRKGYFITSEMVTQLSNKNIRGVLYLMLAALSKSGYDIRNIYDLSIDAGGNEVLRQKGMPDCVKIEFSPINDKDNVKTMYYVRTNLSNGNKSLSSITKFVEKFKFTTFIKSASYVLHDRTASKIRQFITDVSGAVFQDDTGVPFKCFSSNRWNIFAFGMYEKPALPVFRAYIQRDLANFFKSGENAGIPFYCGYGTSSNTARSNLVLAIRKPSEPESADKMRAEKKNSSEKESGGCPCKKNKKSVVIARSETTRQSSTQI
ncbi:MAG: hypothetical protein LBJ96_04055 [Holosporaceae bacterium]|jgi:hypothetical protein|nr:hypothetical protein [Holosporaceae bacterium]